MCYHDKSYTVFFKLSSRKVVLTPNCSNIRFYWLILIDILIQKGFYYRWGNFIRVYSLHLYKTFHHQSHLKPFFFPYSIFLPFFLNTHLHPTKFWFMGRSTSVHVWFLFKSSIPSSIAHWHYLTSYNWYYFFKTFGLWTFYLFSNSENTTNNENTTNKITISKPMCWFDYPYLPITHKVIVGFQICKSWPSRVRNRRLILFDASSSTSLDSLIQYQNKRWIIKYVTKIWLYIMIFIHLNALVQSFTTSLNVIFQRHIIIMLLACWSYYSSFSDTKILTCYSHL